MNTKRKVVFLLYDQVNAIDIAGPAEAFASITHRDGRKAYQIVSWAVGDLVVRTESGIRMCADRDLPSKPKADILIVPGGKGIREPEILHRTAKWLGKHSTQFERIAAVCTGAYALAESGLVDGCSITTHWAHAKDLQSQYPKVLVDADSLFLQDGRYYSSGGVTSGIDLALDLIEADFGSSAAMNAARELVVFLRRPGSQAQYSLPLEFQSGAPSALADTCNWAAGNLDSDLSVEALAMHAGLSPRHFSRSFRKAFGTPPASFVKRLRLDAGRTLLSQGVGLARIAAATNFKSTDGFSRAFESEFGVLPSEYRRRFWLKRFA